MITRAIFLLVASSVIFLNGCTQSTELETDSPINWVKDFDSALQKAQAEQKPMFVDFYATWCGPCKMMDKKTFPDPKVLAELDHWIPVKIDVDKNQALAEKYKIQGIPTTIAFDSKGEMVGMKVGFLSPEQLVSFADAARKRITSTPTQTNSQPPTAGP